MDFNWLNLLALITLSGGHAALVIALVNRLHGLPFRRETLRITRGIHDILIAAFPPAVIWFVGVHGPRLLWSSDWASLPMPLLAYLGV